MQFEQAGQTAERLGVTVRAIQKWANEGRIPGAKKVGREWMIPVGLVKPLDKVQISDKPRKIRMAMPLLNSSFTPGKCREYIDCIPDEDDRKIALGEYYYFSGQAELCTKTVEEYQNRLLQKMKDVLEDSSVDESTTSEEQSAPIQEDTIAQNSK